MRVMLTVLLAAGLFSPALAADADGKVRIVVMRIKQPAGVQAPADILEVKDGRQEYVGRLWQREMLVIETSSEKKHYMTLGLGTTGEFFFAEPLTPGKTYYVILRFDRKTGAIIPYPARPGVDASPPAEANLSYKAVVPSRADRDAFATQRSSMLIRSEYARVVEEYERKVASQIAEHTLRAQDAFDYTPR